MGQCSKGKSCGASCIERKDKCRIELGNSSSASLESLSRKIKSQPIEDILEKLFGVRPPSRKVQESASLKGELDDVSRLLRGEKPKNIPMSRDQKSKGAGEVTRLQKALGLGDLTRQEVGRDWQVLKGEALRRKDELRKEIKKLQVLGGAKAKAKERELRKELDGLNDALKAGAGGKKGPVSQATREARIGAKYFDQGFNLEKAVSGRAQDFDWEGNSRRGTNGKKGGFGSVLFQGDAVVKRGDIGENELEIIRKVGKAGLGPELIYGEIGKRKETFASVGIHDGRVAMTRVEGKEVGRFQDSQEKIGNATVGDTYWRARAELHRIGVAHNDSHGDNVIVDSSGRPRWVDFGISQDNPKAALSEAFGAIVNRQILPAGAVIQGGMKRDIQSGLVKTSGISSPPKNQPENLRRIYSNVPAAKSFLQGLGMGNDEIAQVMASGIRNPESAYNKGAWGKLTNDDALKVIGILYDGI